MKHNNNLFPTGFLDLEPLCMRAMRPAQMRNYCVCVTFGVFVLTLIFCACFWWLRSRVIGRHGFSRPASVQAVRGGGCTSRRRGYTLSVAELKTFRLLSGSLSDMGDTVSLTWEAFIRGPDISSYEDMYEDCVVVDMPVSSLLGWMPYQQLVVLAKLHQVHISRAQRSLQGVCAILTVHKCTAICSHIWCCFSRPSPHGGRLDPIQRTNQPTHREDGNRSVRGIDSSAPHVSTAWLTWFKHVAGDARLIGGAAYATYECALSRDAALMLIESRHYIVAYDIPLRDLMIELTRESFLDVLRIHDIHFDADPSMSDIVTRVVGHRCEGMGCSNTVTLFSFSDIATCTVPPPPVVPLPIVPLPVAPPLLDHEPIQAHPFPPAFQNHETLASYVQGWCESTSAASIYENPCSVCGRLTLLADLFDVERSSIDLRPLCRVGRGITRKE